MSKYEVFLLGLGLGMFFGVIAMALFFCGIYADFQDEAIDRGFAHYVIVDKHTGTTEFKWKTDKGE